MEVETALALETESREEDLSFEDFFNCVSTGSVDVESVEAEDGEDELSTLGRALDLNDTRVHEDVFFLVDLSFPVRKLRRWQRLLPRVKTFYAVKCNPNALVVRALAATGQCGFDCASISEMELVLREGVAPSCIIFANPCKTPDALQFALQRGVLTMTFDSVLEAHKIRRELDALREAQSTPVGDPQLVMRLRVPDANSDVPLGEKYGAPPQACEDLMDRALALRLPVVGVSFHCGSGCHDVESYRCAIVLARQVFDMAAHRGLRLRLLDIGGGFPGFDGTEHVFTHPQPDAPPRPLSCEAIADAVRPLIDQLFPPQSGVKVISEPGRYFCEGSHALFVRIYAVRMVDEDGVRVSGLHDGMRVVYLLPEGVLGCFKDALLCGEQFVPRAVTNGPQSDLKTYETVILGPSGEKYDCVGSARLPLLRAGDWLFFTRMGAYTASIAAATSAVYRGQRACVYVAKRFSTCSGW